MALLNHKAVVNGIEYSLNERAYQDLNTVLEPFRDSAVSAVLPTTAISLPAEPKEIAGVIGELLKADKPSKRLKERATGLIQSLTRKEPTPKDVPQ